MSKHTITINHTGPFLKRNQTIYTAADGFLQKEFGRRIQVTNLLWQNANNVDMHLTVLSFYGKGFKYPIWKEQNLKSKNNFE